MHKILIGSSAIKHHFPDFHREPNDIDYIGIGENIPGKVEYHENPTFEGYPHDVMKPDDLYTLKISHMFWDIKWEKHMFDIVFLRSRGCMLNMYLFHALYAFWQQTHGLNKRSNLSMDKESFFNNALKKYDHDHLHTLLNPIPIYTKILKDGKQVEVSEVKFKRLTHTEKLELVREEVYVMAYERLNGRDYRSAYTWMLKKFIMNHAPMWEALFIIENFRELALPNINYKQKLDYELSRNPS